MARSQRQSRRRGGRKPIPSQPRPTHPADLSRYEGTEKHGPTGGPKPPLDPAARKLTWKN